MWTVNDFPAYGMLSGWIHMMLSHVQFAKINYVGRTCSMDEKFRGLTVICVSSHDTMRSGEIEIRSQMIE